MKAAISWETEMPALSYLSANLIEKLYAEITDNLDRYLSGSFNDLAKEDGWQIPLKLEIDLSPLEALDSTVSPESEIANSRIVWSVLKNLTPSLASDERTWVRLTHIECLDFTRNRWLKGVKKEDQVSSIKTHFFADTLTKRRDDNAISRLWWNAYIADQIRPNSDLEPLSQFLRRADIRSNFVERSRTLSRAPVAAGVLRIMEKESWFYEKEANFRTFMIELNRIGAGVLFEALPSETIDKIMTECFERSRAAT